MRFKYRNIFTGALMLMLISVFLSGVVSAQNNGNMASSKDEISSGDSQILNGMDFRGNSVES